MVLWACGAGEPGGGDPVHGDPGGGSNQDDDTTSGSDDDSTQPPDDDTTPVPDDDSTPVADDDTTPAGPCPPEMALVEEGAIRVCVDRWEAFLEQVGKEGKITPWSPYEVPEGVEVRARAQEGAMPQGYISGEQAEGACEGSGKRLCSDDEWMLACQGPEDFTYPYGNSYQEEACNEGRESHPVIEFYGTSADWVWTTEAMNDPGINQLPDTVALSGALTECVSSFGLYDLHGNLHEWTAASEGTFRGGFYVDAELNGPGCTYRTTAHEFTYHDYSTGFRCCRDPE